MRGKKARVHNSASWFHKMLFRSAVFFFQNSTNLILEFLNLCIHLSLAVYLCKDFFLCIYVFSHGHVPIWQQSSIACSHSRVVVSEKCCTNFKPPILGYTLYRYKRFHFPFLQTKARTVNRHYTLNRSIVKGILILTAEVYKSLWKVNVLSNIGIYVVRAKSSGKGCIGLFTVFSESTTS